MKAQHLLCPGSNQCKADGSIPDVGSDVFAVHAKFEFTVFTIFGRDCLNTLTAVEIPPSQSPMQQVPVKIVLGVVTRHRPTLCW